MLKFIYDAYDDGYARPNALFRAHRLIIGNPWLARALFGVRVNPARLANGYFDLTTLLLRGELRRQVRRYMYPRLLEIGVGRYAVLSGYLARRVKHRVVACDIDAAAVESAAEHVEKNGINVEVLHSDVLGSIPVNEYDVVFWNLPYYADVRPLLTRLFSTAPDYMSGSARLVIGFNTRPLPVATVLDVLSHFPALELERRRRYWWNRHAVLIVRRA